MTALMRHREKACAKKSLIASLTQGIKQIQAKHALRKLAKVSKQLSCRRSLKQRVCDYHARHLFRSASQRWFSYFQHKQAAKRTLQKFQTRRDKDCKQRTLCLWTKAAARALKNVRAASKTNRLSVKLEKRHYLARWSAATAFLIRLEKLERNALLCFKKKRISRALRHFKLVASALAETRIRNEQARVKARHRLVKKALHRLRGYQKERSRRTASKALAFAFFVH